MNSRATIAVWGCIVCSNVWMARANLSSVLPFAFAAMWLSFAVLIVLAEGRDAAPAAPGGEG